MRIQEIVERALAASTADGCVVIAEESSSANLRWASNTLTTNGVTRGRQVVVIAMVDGAQGTATGVLSLSNPDPAALDEIVAEATAAARDNEPADDAMPLITAAQAGPAGDWAAEPMETSIGVFAAVAEALGAAFTVAGAANRLLFGFAQHSASTVYLGTSTGLRLRHEQPTGRLELNGKSADYSRSAWAGAATRDFSDVDVTALDAGVTQRLGWAQRRIDLPAGRYEVVLPPSAVADLMVNAYWSTAGRDAAEGRTVFSAPGGRTRLGEKLTDLPVTLRSDPAAAGLQCCPFVVSAASDSTSSVFDNGLAVEAVDWIRDGVLTNLAHTRWSAHEFGADGPTPGADNLVMSAPGASGDLTELIGRTERGLLLTCLWYIREVDAQTLLLTGLTRDGVYLVENGEVIGAVNNFRFNESPIDLLGRLLEVGASVPALPREWADWFTRTAMPPVRVADFNMSSVSAAT
ncbi:MAG TPA: metallopeptidase TldD-related protein [Sporichthyaceae bacterium]|jgi:predicted Zn-dependent protease|nr:metallopeptidase TldD-related protein [Sporichthyaceae bacterium]